MEKNQTAIANISGHLQISKVYSGGEEEVVFDDHNIIVSGMGVGLSYLFSTSGSDNILDYQIDRFQVGTGGATSLEVSSTDALGNNLAAIGYGSDTNLTILNNATTKQVIGGTPTVKPFAVISENMVTRVNDTSVRYTLVLDEDTANGFALNEVGLFMKNPEGVTGETRSRLVAYRYFSDITKNEDFGLIFRWTINF